MTSLAVEVVFSFDTTGSMYPCLTQVRRHVKSTVTRLGEEIPGIRIGIIAHGDYCDAGSTYVTKHLPLTDDVVKRHLSGDLVIGLYPLFDGDRCWWLAADFDGRTAMLDALAYIKAARSAGVPAGLEVSRSGTGAHVWIFFAAPIPAATARQIGSGLLRDRFTQAEFQKACRDYRIDHSG